MKLGSNLRKRLVSSGADAQKAEVPGPKNRHRSAGMRATFEHPRRSCSDCHHPGKKGVPLLVGGQGNFVLPIEATASERYIIWSVGSEERGTEAKVSATHAPLGRRRTFRTISDT
jgi:hypothetical protein